MSLSSINKQPTAGTLSWRFISSATGKNPRLICCHGISWMKASSRWRLRALVITSLSAGPFSPLPGLDSLGASRGSLLSWNILLEVRPCCAIASMNCSCCEINVCSKTLASASTLTCNLWRQLFADWRVLLSCALMRPSSGTLCCIRLHTSSIFRWVSWSFLA